MTWMLVAALLLFMPVFGYAQNLNAGFVQGIWYSHSPFFAGDIIRIYTAIQNNSGFDIRGTVEFIANGSPLGQSSFSVVNGRIAETWADWNVAQGTNIVGARVTEAMKLEIGKEPVPITLQHTSLGAHEIFVDEDTDKDAIGNNEDLDDDNDGLSDIQEHALGTNPLKQDSDNDGFSDKQERDAGTDPLVYTPKNTSITNTTAQHQPDTSKYPEPTKHLAQQLTEKTLEEHIPAIEEYIDSFMQSATENMEKRQRNLQEKEQAIVRRNPKESLSIPEQGLNIALLVGLYALPKWKIMLILAAALAIVYTLRRLIFR
jgi:hypothetical protein